MTPPNKSELEDVLMWLFSSNKLDDVKKAQLQLEALISEAEKAARIDELSELAYFANALAEDELFAMETHIRQRIATLKGEDK